MVCLSRASIFLLLFFMFICFFIRNYIFCCFFNCLVLNITRSTREIRLAIVTHKKPRNGEYWVHRKLIKILEKRAAIPSLACNVPYPKPRIFSGNISAAHAFCKVDIVEALIPATIKIREQ